MPCHAEPELLTAFCYLHLKKGERKGKRAREGERGRERERRTDRMERKRWREKEREGPFWTLEKDMKTESQA